MNVFQMESPRACNSRAVCLGQIFTQSGEVVTPTTHGPIFFLKKHKLGDSFSVMVSSWEFAYPEIFFCCSLHMQLVISLTQEGMIRVFKTPEENQADHENQKAISKL